MTRRGSCSPQAKKIKYLGMLRRDVKMVAALLMLNIG